MARQGPLTCLKKRNLLNDPAKPVGRLVEAAEAQLAAGLFYDAVSLFGRAKELERVEELADRAVEEGDLFLYLFAVKTAGKEPQARLLADLADKAGQRGLDLFARRARAMVGAEEGETVGGE